MRHATVIAVVLLLADVATAASAPASAPAPAPVERFIGENTIFAAEADLAGVDASDIARWVTEFLLLACVPTDAGELARARANAPAQQARVAAWINDFRVAAGGGACPIVCVTEQSWMLDGGYALYVPVPPGGDAAGIEVLLGGGPEIRARKKNQPRHRFDWHSDVKIWPDRVVGLCMGAAHAPPAPAPGRPRRPEFVEALPARGPGAVGKPVARLVLVPDEATRETVARNLHAGWEFIKPMRWLAIRYDAAPLPLKAPARLTMVYRAHDADGARAVAAAWTRAINAIYTGAGLEHAEAQPIVRQLTPAVEGDRIVLSIAADELPRLIAQARPAIRKAWRLPPPPPPPPSTRSALRRNDPAGAPDGRAQVGYD